MSFHRENKKYNNWTLIYKITLGESLLFNSNLTKVTQSEWLWMPTKLSPSLLKELGINQINNQGSSYMKIISNSLLDSKIIFIRSLFFQTFYKKSLMFLIIMLKHCSLLSKITAFWFLGVLDIFLNTIPYWIDASRISIILSLPNDHLYSLDTWRCEGMVLLV